jgi:hypothetical protein
VSSADDRQRQRAAWLRGDNWRVDTALPEQLREACSPLMRQWNALDKPVELSDVADLDHLVGAMFVLLENHRDGSKVHAARDRAATPEQFVAELRKECDKAISNLRKKDDVSRLISRLKGIESEKFYYFTQSDHHADSKGKGLIANDLFSRRGLNLNGPFVDLPQVHVVRCAAEVVRQVGAPLYIKTKRTPHDRTKRPKSPRLYSADDLELLVDSVLETAPTSWVTLQSMREILQHIVLPREREIDFNDQSTHSSTPHHPSFNAPPNDSEKAKLIEDIDSMLEGFDLTSACLEMIRLTNPTLKDKVIADISGISTQAVSQRRNGTNSTWNQFTELTERHNGCDNPDSWAGQYLANCYPARLATTLARRWVKHNTLSRFSLSNESLFDAFFDAFKAGPAQLFIRDSEMLQETWSTVCDLVSQMEQ